MFIFSVVTFPKLAKHTLQKTRYVQYPYPAMASPSWFHTHPGYMQLTPDEQTSTILGEVQQFIVSFTFSFPRK